LDSRKREKGGGGQVPKGGVPEGGRKTVSRRGAKWGRFPYLKKLSTHMTNSPGGWLFSVGPDPFPGGKGEKKKKPHYQRPQQKKRFVKTHRNFRPGGKIDDEQPRGPLFHSGGTPEKNRLYKKGLCTQICTQEFQTKWGEKRKRVESRKTISGSSIPK